MLLKSMNRFQASAWHLLASANIATLFALVVFLLWYPEALAYASGVTDIFLLLLVVDVVLGPVITLIIFNPQKKELKRDLAIIVVVQLAALFYGMQTVFIARPAFLVFNATGFDLVYANEISTENLANAKLPEYTSLPISGPSVVAAKMPSDPELAGKIVSAAIFGGDDLQHMPEYYVSYDSQKQSVLRNIRPLEDLKKSNNDRNEKVLELLAKYSAVNDEGVGYLPINAKAHDVIAVVSRISAEILEISELRSL